MKTVLRILIFFISLNSFAQIDSTLDFKTRFYSNNVIIANNTFKDSLKDGYWIEHFDKKWNKCNEKGRAFYRLIEYRKGKPIGKVYDFYNSGKLQMVGEFEQLDPEIKKGTFIWFSRKGKRTSLEYYNADSIIEKSYYRKGNLMSDRVYLRGRDFSSYDNKYWYFKNGNIESINYYDKKQDTSFYLTKRRNGIIDYRETYAKGKLEKTTHNKKGELVERISRKSKYDTLFIEKFKKGQLLTTEKEIYKSNNDTKYIGKYEIVTFYQGQLLKSRGVFIIHRDSITDYYVDDKKLSEIEYFKFEKERKEFIKKRKKNHYYKEYTKDSLLVYEGHFKNINQPCGIYYEYYNNGQIKIRGWFDRKGRKTGRWRYYTQDGEFYYSEYYRKGIITTQN